MRYVQKKFECKCGWAIYKCLDPKELKTLLTVPCNCGKKAKRMDLGFSDLAKNSNTMGAIHAEGGVRIFENGKRKTLSTKRAVKEYEARNNCTFGSDDLEQESEINRNRLEREDTERATEKITENFERLQWQKRRC